MDILEKKSSNASIIMSLLIVSSTITSIMGSFINTDFRMGIIVMALIFIMSIAYFVRYQEFHFNKYLIFLVFYILSVLIISNALSDGYIVDVTLAFLEYGTIGLLIGTMPIDAKKVGKYASVMWIITAIPAIIAVGRSTSNIYTNDINMEASYAVIPIVFTVIYYFVIYVEERKFWNFLAFCFAVFMLFELVIKGTRGAWICYICFFLFLYLKKSKSSPRKKIVFCVIIALSALIIAINFSSILTTIGTYLHSKGISVYAIEKSVFLTSSNSGISNGRIQIYKCAIDGIVAKPFLGHGIGSFHDMYPQMNYPHNIILQLIFELGIVGSAILLLTVFQIIRYAFIICLKQTNKFDLFLICFAISIPMLFISNQLWGERFFWFILSYYYTNKVAIQEGKVNDERSRFYSYNNI